MPERTHGEAETPQTRPDPDRELRSAYAEHLRDELLPSVLTGGVGIAVANLLVFIPVDYFGFPEVWKALFTVRMSERDADVVAKIAAELGQSLSTFGRTAFLRATEDRRHEGAR